MAWHIATMDGLPAYNTCCDTSKNPQYCGVENQHFCGVWWNSQQIDCGQEGYKKTKPRKKRSVNSHPPGPRGKRM